MKKALILVDIQNDFLPPEGALAVPNGREIVPVAVEAVKHFDHVVATLDWHPADHGSFASQYEGKNPGDLIVLDGLDQVLWPDHCIHNSFGSQLADDLNFLKIDKVITKGLHKSVDSYSGFFDNAKRHKTGLDDFLREKDVKEVSIIGLATDYCIKFTAIDACELGYKTNLIKEGVRGVELNEGDCDKAFADMEAAGVNMMSIHDLKS